MAESRLRLFEKLEVDQNNGSSTSLRVGMIVSRRKVASIGSGIGSGTPVFVAEEWKRG